ncbi:MAG: hypothetical protein FJ147_05765 [Deltaproteobacteria bacterium]|nr:hypothetical protein [Deltaproteobacteria bacterium]
MRCRTIVKWGLLAVALLIFGDRALVQAEAETPVAQIMISPAFVRWQPLVTYASLDLRVAVPDGRVLSRKFTPGQPIGFDVVDERGQRFPDGQYTYELIVAPPVDPSVSKALQQARAAGTDAAVVAQMQQQGVLPRQAQTQSGYFTVLNGTLVVPGVEE